MKREAVKWKLDRKHYSIIYFLSAYHGSGIGLGNGYIDVSNKAEFLRLWNWRSNGGRQIKNDGNLGFNKRYEEAERAT